MTPTNDGPNFYRANRVSVWIFNRLGVAAITMPWKSVYLHPDYLFDQRIRNHETAHVAQINRDGALKWSILVVWYVIRYGYTNSPYEIEAREHEGN